MVNSTMLDLGSNRSVIRELFEYGKKRAAECGAENVFDYSLGNPSIPSPAEVNENAVRIMRERSSIAVHGYTSAVGDNGVRTAVADDLNARFGTSYKKENLFMTCGAAASLISVFRALTVDHSSEILAIAPFFPEYECFVKANGGVFGYVPADVPSFQIDFEKLEAMISENTQAVIINSPNNPSGVVYSEETVERLADLLTQKSARFGHPIYIISDEPYRELVYGSATVPWVPSFYKNTIVCYSYSKSLSLPGERIGYVLVPSECDGFTDVYNAVAGGARASGFVCAPSLWQYTVGACASSRPDIAGYDENRRLLCGALTEIGYKFAPPHGAFYLFIESPTGDGASFSEIAMKHNLLLVPGNGFKCDSYLRAAYCVDGEMIKRSIPAFRAAYLEATGNA